MSKKIKLMQAGGEKLARIRDKLLEEAKEGVKTIELDRLAERLILETGGKPSFKMVAGFNWSTCICVNDCIVHGVPSNYILKKGDLVTVDIGLFFGGFHTDTASTIVVGSINKRHEFLLVGKKALTSAINKAIAGNRIGDISFTMQKIIEDAGFNVARTLVGHSIGRKLHMKPQIPCFLAGGIKDTAKLKEGMTIAVEVIYMKGSYALILDSKDNWTMRTKDKSPSAMFEHTIAVTKNSPLVLTQ